ncbi:MAG: response regulator [Pontiella sp.]
MNKILIIDDDPTIQNVFGQFLRGAGYEVLSAENGKVGMKIMQENRPDLIITDILMPEMDGLEILLQIRNEHDNMPIIAISGGMRALPINFLRQAKLFGACHVFEKPVPLNVLLEAIQTILPNLPTIATAL